MAVSDILTEYPKIKLSIHDLEHNKMCDLYDSETTSPGQAYDIQYVNQMNGWETLQFSLPFKLPDGKTDNHRWDFITNEYLVRLVERNRVVWFVITSPKKTHNKSGVSEVVNCTTLLTQLTTKNIYLEYDGDETGIDTMPNLVKDVLRGTGWSLDEDNTDTLFEKDGTTEKIRSLKSTGKSGAYKLLTDICNLFNCYMTVNTANKTVAIHSMENKLPLREMMIGKDLSTLSVTYDTDDIITRLYVEGEYADDGYVGIDSVNPTGLTYIFNFDYYKEIGLFTDEHQTILDNYIAAMTSLVSQINTLTATYNTNSNTLNTYWG